MSNEKDRINILNIRQLAAEGLNISVLKRAEDIFSNSNGQRQKPETESTSEQGFQGLWSTIIKGRIARLVLIEQTMSGQQANIPQNGHLPATCLLENSTYLAGGNMQYPKLPDLPLPLANEQVEAATAAHSIIYRQLYDYLDSRFQIQYGKHATGLRRLVEKGSLSAIAAFPGGNEQELHSYLHQQIITIGAEQLLKTKEMIPLSEFNFKDYEGMIWEQIRNLRGAWESAHLSAEDVLQEASLALVTVWKRYNPTKALIFSTYAIPRIKGSILDQIRRSDGKRIRGLKDFDLMDSFIFTYEQANQTEPTPEEIAEGTGLSLNRITEMIQKRSYIVVPLEESFPGLDEESLGLEEITEDPYPLIQPDRQLLKKEDHAELAKAISTLPEREQQIISLYYSQNYTLKEISKMFDISESRVCQLNQRILFKLRRQLRAQNFTRT